MRRFPRTGGISAASRKATAFLVGLTERRARMQHKSSAIIRMIYITEYVDLIRYDLSEMFIVMRINNYSQVLYHKIYTISTVFCE